ncbi:MAG: hypothetical protein EON54_21470, partial [Alcaligenaceae bacterium]
MQQVTPTQLRVKLSQGVKSEAGRRSGLFAAACDENFLSRLESSQWMHYVRLVLAAAQKIAVALSEEGASCITHCIAAGSAVSCADHTSRRIEDAGDCTVLALSSDNGLRGHLIPREVHANGVLSQGVKDVLELTFL